METQATQNQEQEPRSYENSPWINVYDWQVTEHTNRETGDSFWSVKLASDTFIEHDGQRVDVGRHVFTTNYEPSVTHGEPGTPRCTRGIHFPQDWDITLKRFENVAGKDETPVFKEVNRVEGVTPEELAEGVHERNAAWRSAHRKESQEQTVERNAHEQSRPDHAKQHSMEPSL